MSVTLATSSALSSAPCSAAHSASCPEAHAACANASARGLATLRAGLAVLAVALLLSAAACLCAPQRAWADFTVYVGYAGGPYYEKATFTDAQLAAMADTSIYQYSSISGVDSQGAGFLSKGYGAGVHLYDLFTAAGVDPATVWRFYFSTEDSYVVDDGGTGYDAWYYNNLVGTTRYYYPDLPRYFNFDTGQIQNQDAMDLLEQTRVETPTILAIKSSFVKISSADDSKWTNQAFMSRDAGYRLLYGQTAPNVSNSRASAHGIVSMTCILGGNEGVNIPEVDMNVEADQLDMKVGESITLFPTLNAEDETVSQMGIHDVTWTTSDPEIATVKKNDDGSITITIVGEGVVSIGYTFGNSPYEAFLSTGSFGVSGTGSGGDGEGDGGGDEEGDDDASSNGFADSIALSAGTEMFAASVDASSAGETGSSSAGGDPASADSTGETVAAEEMLQITATADAYKLEFEELEVEDEAPAWMYAVAAGSCLAVGGVRRKRQFERAKDHVMGSPPAVAAAARGEEDSTAPAGGEGSAGAPEGRESERV